MFDLGTQELILIFIVAFLVFGPKKLPELGRTLGKGIRELKSAMRGVTASFEEAGSDLTDELKGAKSDLEDSIYKSIEPNLKKNHSEQEKESKKEEDAPISTGEKKEKKEKKETDGDG
jgi:TatA/E family protein of Tat protein translocase